MWSRWILLPSTSRMTAPCAHSRPTWTPHLKLLHNRRSDRPVTVLCEGDDVAHAHELGGPLNEARDPQRSLLQTEYVRGCLALNKPARTAFYLTAPKKKGKKRMWKEDLP
ncbi:hypothetical protein EDB89DRAFT_546417 [Lactarius sanguifluus]|nr:hypothetical protein EDB89DRAFT_546417 [Lactarius sanguifluus]